MRTSIKNVVTILVFVYSLIFFFYGELPAQTVTGRVVDKSGVGIEGLTLQLYISPNIYDAYSSFDGSFLFSGITGIEKGEIPIGFSVSENFPNPFNPTTRIIIHSPKSCNANLTIFNTLGERVSPEIERSISAGDNFFDLELNGLVNGIYFARIVLDAHYTVVRKLMLLYGSQHLAKSGTGTLFQQSGSLRKSFSAIKIDSLVVSGTSFGNKVYNSLPGITGDYLNLGNLTIIPDNIETGASINVLSTIVDNSGGTMVVSTPGTPLDGMEISVPQNSFTSATTFDVAYAEIKQHQFGEDFHPVTPVISVTSAGGYSSDIISLKIPIQLPEDHFAMGFLYNDKSGKLEGMPVESIENNTITISTRNFSDQRTGLYKTHDGTSTIKMVVTTISESALNGKAIIATGFKPGVDDWEFPNYGSYAESGGHCAGQSMSAMWYYFEKKLSGEGDLYNKYDELFLAAENGDNYWFDNPRGYRFASVVQSKLEWDSYLYKLFCKIEQKPNYHLYSWKAFALSMLVTGEPQFVGLSSTKGGHAIIAHKISLSDKKLYVTDPNFPGKEREIVFNGSRFLPYSTKQNAGEVDLEAYTGIGYFAKTSMIEWNKIGELWKKFEDKTIGNDIFPAYKLFYRKNGEFAELKDSTIVTEEKIEFNIGYIDSLIYYILDKQGKFYTQEISLNEGENVFGFLILAKPKGKNEHKWIDFKWVKIIYDDPGIITSCPESVTHAGKVYNTVKIGNQCWLRENLNVGVMILNTQESSDNGVIEKYCYQNQEKNCDTHGGLYQWAEAVQYKNGATNNRLADPPFTGNVQGLCPEGWHIPSKAEFDSLKAAVNNDGNALKKVGEGWGTGAGTNTSGFSALLTGYRNASTYWGNSMGVESWFFSSTENPGNGNVAYFLQIHGASPGIGGPGESNKAHGVGIRCVMDSN